MQKVIRKIYNTCKKKSSDIVLMMILKLFGNFFTLNLFRFCIGDGIQNL